VSLDNEDILFWQEPAREDIPGNMQLILQGNYSRTQTILVQKRKAYDKLIALGANPQIVQLAGVVYPFVKENHHRPHALICTNSDHIIQCQKFVEGLPQLHFHIAAITEMSPRLMRMGQYDNVSLYPGITMELLDELFETCDYYLDINEGSEIVSAVYQAFLHNQLVYAFTQTVHNRDYIPDEHCYSLQQGSEMMEEIRSILEDANRLEEHLKLQREFALAETAESFREKIEKRC
jgi:accessory Sec system glycosyltransferase GtfB